MTRRWVLGIIAVNLIALAALVFAYPHLMVAPGALREAHAALATDCFACHAPGRGTTAERCVACHAIKDIGVRTTKGIVLAKPHLKVAFHRDLIEQECASCHSDHNKPLLAQRNRKPFSHALLREATRENCVACHAPPDTAIHRNMNLPCGQCHQQEKWKPASFKHDQLGALVLAKCETCHATPTDTLHRPITGNCAQCHTPAAWKPASFDHAKFFVLDRDHNVSCATCHTNNDYKRYTCYGCHEHTPERIRAKHQREGIRNFTHCVECHRSADENEGGKGRKEKSGGERD